MNYDFKFITFLSSSLSYFILSFLFITFNRLKNLSINKKIDKKLNMGRNCNLQMIKKLSPLFINKLKNSL